MLPRKGLRRWPKRGRKTGCCHGAGSPGALEPQVQSDSEGPGNWTACFSILISAVLPRGYKYCLGTLEKGPDGGDQGLRHAGVRLSVCFSACH